MNAKTVPPGRLKKTKSRRRDAQRYGYALGSVHAVGAPDAAESIGRQHCEKLERFFRAAENPIWATRAYVECRNAKIEIPEWVLKCFDAAAAGTKSRRRFNLQTELRDNWLASEVSWRLLDVPKTAAGIPTNGQLKRILMEIAQENGISATTVFRAWKRFGDAFPDSD